MRKKLIIIIFFVFLIIPLVSSANIQMKQNFKQEETLMANVSENFINPPSRENILFYKGHTRIAMDAYLGKINENYYIYSSLSGKAPGNYSIKIKDISYKKGSKTISNDLIKNFTIEDAYAPFSINPGFIITKDDFDIIVNNFQDNEIELKLKITTLSGDETGISNYKENKEHKINLKSGENKIEFELGALNYLSEKQISLTSEGLEYLIPVSLLINPEQSKFFSFEVSPSSYSITLPNSSSIKKLIYIYNKGTGTLTNVRLNLSDSLKPFVTISTDRFESILPSSNGHLNMSIVTGGEKTLSGNLIVTTDEKLSKSIPIYIKVKAGAPQQNISELTTDKTCNDPDISGIICSKDEFCEGDLINAKDSECCIGKCKKIPSKPNWKLIGWVLIFILIIGGV